VGGAMTKREFQMQDHLRIHAVLSAWHLESVRGQRPRRVQEYGPEAEPSGNGIQSLRPGGDSEIDRQMTLDNSEPEDTDRPTPKIIGLPGLVDIE